MPNRSTSKHLVATHNNFFYGWVIVAVCTIIIAITYGLLNSYSVFFKPLADYFNWDRASVSLIYSASLIIGGAIAVGIGWLADRYGSAKLMAFCGFMICAGLILSSQVHLLWQLFLTYSIIEAVGLAGAVGIAAASVSRWFTKNRGLALGIVASGFGLGTFLIVPGNERLISIFGWSKAFIVAGSSAGILMIALSFLLKPPPGSILSNDKKLTSVSEVNGNNAARKIGMHPGRRVKDYRIVLLITVFFFSSFSVQLIMVHLVNYATDIGISPLTAASLISVVGAVSIAGRLSSGVVADKIGTHNTLILTRAFLITSFICLIFAHSLWMFYLFAVIFALAYSGDNILIPLLLGTYFGTKAMATMVSGIGFVAGLGGAAGVWAAGKIFDNTQSYLGAFIAGAIAGLVSLIMILMMKRQNQRNPELDV